jgi:hypothetical protein
MSCVSPPDAREANLGERRHPAFRIKHDVVPGQYETLWFQATTPGRYHVFCAEYCATGHASMGDWVTRYGSGEL